VVKLPQLDQVVNRALGALRALLLPGSSIPSFAAARRLIVFGLLLCLGLVAAPAVLGAQGQPEPEPGSLIVRRLKFEGAQSINTLTLANSIVTTQSSWAARIWPFRALGLGEKRFFSEREFVADVLRLRVLYRRSGFPDVQIDTLVRRTPEDIFITFRIEEGLPVRIDSLAVTGLDSVPPHLWQPATVDLPLQEGDVFSRYLMQTSADTITQRLHDRGYPTADVFTSFSSNAERRTATVVLEVHPGTRASVGAIRTEGARRVDTATVEKLLAAREGRRYQESDLFRSTRNLYDSELFRFASVDIDTARFVPGMDSVPLVVRVVENTPWRLRTGLGYGTTDCVRGTTGLTGRNFLGQGRVLDVTGRVSKVGVGTPADWGLESNAFCRQLERDSIGSRRLNYNLTAALRQPAFLSPNNTVTLSAFTEWRSEYLIYLRQETGVSLGLQRQTPRRRIPLALTYTLSTGRTEATRATFCAFLRACEDADINLLSRRQRLATLTGTGELATVNNPLDPSRGRAISLELTHASRFIGSSPQLQFTRGVIDAAWYKPMSRDVVLSYHVRGGMILAPARQFSADTIAFVPPEQRFYAGGPTDVRGYNRNELGPVVYVTTQSYLASLGDSIPIADADRDSVRVTPTGGNTLAVGNVELRFPSPILRETVRLAAFVDLGALWERGGAGVLGRINPRLTPGVGVRVATPLGPARLDVAYNFSRLQPGPLFATAADGTLVRVSDDYQFSQTNNLTFHFAVGQAF